MTASLAVVVMLVLLVHVRFGVVLAAAVPVIAMLVRGMLAGDPIGARDDTRYRRPETGHPGQFPNEFFW
ncbi:MAG TPA: hypothetical protein EYQ27_09660 [Gemmatimonadetes bacterium]|nr:hypothetical protein [Gemmatimonadota bacterium]